jgi:hypothetical protein
MICTPEQGRVPGNHESRGVRQETLPHSHALGLIISTTKKNFRSDRCLQPGFESSTCYSIVTHATAASCLSAVRVQCRHLSGNCPNSEFTARCYPERKFVNMHPYNRFKRHDGASSPHLSVWQHPQLCQRVNKVRYFATRNPRKLLIRLLFQRNPDQHVR